MSGFGGLRDNGGAGVRAWVQRVRASGHGAAQIDGTVLRARELDRSARRDLAAVLRRNEVGVSGVDLWIPSEHFVRPEHVDRAVGAVVGAIELAADLRTLVDSMGTGRVVGAGDGVVCVCVRLPEGVDEGAVTLIEGSASAHGVWVADFGDGVSVHAGAERALGVGVDAGAAVLAGGKSPTKRVVEAGASLRGVRLGDAEEGVGRCAVGDGGLRVVELRAGLSVAGFGGVVVTDVRGLGEGERLWEAARQASEAWEQAGF